MRVVLVKNRNNDDNNRSSSSNNNNNNTTLGLNVSETHTYFLGFSPFRRSRVAAIAALGHSRLAALTW